MLSLAALATACSLATTLLAPATPRRDSSTPRFTPGAVFGLTIPEVAVLALSAYAVFRLAPPEDHHASTELPAPSLSTHDAGVRAFVSRQA